MDGPVREMTLTEWVDRLPPVHDARKELATLLADLAAARAEIERVRGETIEACAKVCQEFASAVRASAIGQIDPVRTATELEASIRALSRPATGGTT